TERLAEYYKQIAHSLRPLHSVQIRLVGGYYRSQLPPFAPLGLQSSTQPKGLANPSRSMNEIPKGYLNLLKICRCSPSPISTKCCKISSCRRAACAGRSSRFRARWDFLAGIAHWTAPATQETKLVFGSGFRLEDRSRSDKPRPSAS